MSAAPPALPVAIGEVTVVNLSPHSRSCEVQVLRGGPLVRARVALAASLLVVATIWAITNAYLYAPVIAALGGLLLLTLALVLLRRIQRSPLPPASPMPLSPGKAVLHWQ